MYVLFGVVKLIKNTDPHKYSFSGCGNGFDAHRFFSMSDGSGLGKNVIILWFNKSSSVQVYNRKKDILILGKDRADGLDDTTIRAEAKYCINFIEQ